MAKGTRPIFIVLIISGLGPGGAERVITLLANCWAQLGWRVTVLAMDSADTPPYFTMARGIEVRRLNLLSDSQNFVAALSNTVRRVRVLRAELNHSKPNIILSFGDRTNILTLLANLGRGIPVVISDRADPSRQKIGAPWSWLRRCLYPKATALVAQTDRALEFFRDERPRNCVVLPNPIEAPIPAPESDACKIVGVGRLVAQKGFDRLIDAFAQAAPNHPKWSLVIFGDGPDRKNLEQHIAQRDLIGRVHLPGRTQSQGEWIASAGVFALTSRYEGFPNVLGEAMAAGLPVVVFDCRSGPREMIEDEHSGLLVPDGDIAALSVALDRLMSDSKLRTRLGKAARDSARRFAPDFILPKWTDLMVSLIDNGP